jgi:replicative DNA helicase
LSEARDEEAERGTLGGMLLSQSVIPEVLEEVRGEDFATPRNIIVFERITAMYAEGEVVDAITVASSLLASKDLDRVGGAPYLHELMQSTVSPLSAGAYAQRVARAAVMRRFQSATTRIRQMGVQSAIDDVEAVTQLAYAELDAVFKDRKTGWEDGADVLAQVLEEAQNPPERAGLLSGLADVDHFYRGIAPGELGVIAASTSVGKSLAAANFIRHNTIRNNVNTLVFTLEMSSVQYMRRLLAAEAGVTLDRLANPRENPLNDFDWHKINEATKGLYAAPLRIIDESSLGLLDIARIVREEARRGLEFVVIDFHQLLEWPAGVTVEEQAVGRNAYGLRKLAKSTGTSILTLAQLNREPTRRATGVPIISDIAGSKKLGEAASSVILIDRPEIRDENDRPGEAVWIVAKQRDGRTGPVPVVFQGHYARFTNMAPDGM